MSVFNLVLSHGKHAKENGELSYRAECCIFLTTAVLFYVDTSKGVSFIAIYFQLNF